MPRITLNLRINISAKHIYIYILLYRITNFLINKSHWFVQRYLFLNYIKCWIFFKLTKAFFSSEITMVTVFPWIFHLFWWALTQWNTDKRIKEIKHPIGFPKSHLTYFVLIFHISHYIYGRLCVYTYRETDKQTGSFL